MQCLNQTPKRYPQSSWMNHLVIVGTCSVNNSLPNSLIANVLYGMGSIVARNKLNPGVALLGNCDTCYITDPNLTVIFQRPTNDSNLEASFYIFNVTSTGNITIECTVENENSSALTSSKKLITFSNKALSSASGGTLLLFLFVTVLFITCKN